MRPAGPPVPMRSNCRLRSAAGQDHGTQVPLSSGRSTRYAPADWRGATGRLPTVRHARRPHRRRGPRPSGRVCRSVDGGDPGSPAVMSSLPADRRRTASKALVWAAALSVAAAGTYAGLSIGQIGPPTTPATAGTAEERPPDRIAPWALVATVSATTSVYATAGGPQRTVIPATWFGAPLQPFRSWTGFRDGSRCASPNDRMARWDGSAKGPPD